MAIQKTSKVPGQAACQNVLFISFVNAEFFSFISRNTTKKNAVKFSTNYV